MSAVRENGRDYRIVKNDPIPMPDGNPGGKLYDPQGKTISPVRLPLMARIDQKASEKVELSRGTIWLIATALVLAGVIFSYGSTFVAWARDDETQKVKTANIERQVEEMRGEIKDLKKMLEDQRYQDALKRGYELKAAEGAHK